MTDLEGLILKRTWAARRDRYSELRGRRLTSAQTGTKSRCTTSAGSRPAP